MPIPVTAAPQHCGAERGFILPCLNTFLRQSSRNPMPAHRQNACCIYHRLLTALPGIRAASQPVTGILGIFYSIYLGWGHISYSCCSKQPQKTQQAASAAQKTLCVSYEVMCLRQTFGGRQWRAQSHVEQQQLCEYLRTQRQATSLAASSGTGQVGKTGLSR